MLERRYIHGITGVETLSDALDIRKNPAALAALRLAGGAAAGAVADKGANALIDAAKDRLSGKQKELDTATNELATAEENAAAQAESQQTPPFSAPADTETGQGVGIDGMDSEESDTPEQDGDLSAPDPSGLNQDPKATTGDQIALSIDKNWFLDNFAMTGSEMASLLILKKEMAALDALYPLLIEEKKAILMSFPGVSPDLVKSLPLTDVDYDSLNRYSERLGIPFRRFIKMWESAATPLAKQESYNGWREVIDADLRLSMRERNILSDCADILLKKGALNAQTLKFNGVSASPAEISSLIKSHGFLYDIISVGEVSKSVGRGLFYDVKRRDVILKDAARFLAGLIDNQAIIKFDTRYNPRLELGFSAPTAPWYADALNNELEVNAVSASAGGLCIEGQSAVTKVLDVARPYISKENRAINLLDKAFQGNEAALAVVIHDSLDKKKQIAFLKTKRISVEEFDLMKEEVMVNGS